jgi:predicted kinase
MPIIFNATNLLDHHREYLHRSTEETGAKLILVWVEAPTEVVRQRLLVRDKTAIPQGDSNAGWKVYTKMKPQREKFLVIISLLILHRILLR